MTLWLDSLKERPTGNSALRGQSMAIMVSPGHPKQRCNEAWTSKWPCVLGAPRKRSHIGFANKNIPGFWRPTHKVQAQLFLSTTQQPWACSLASKSLSFLICKVGTVLSPPHQTVNRHRRCLCSELGIQHRTQIWGLVWSISPPPQLAVRSN